VKCLRGPARVGYESTQPGNLFRCRTISPCRGAGPFTLILEGCPCPHDQNAQATIAFESAAFRGGGGVETHCGQSTAVRTTTATTA
jgi:hypothetical protein